MGIAAVFLALGACIPTHVGASTTQPAGVLAAQAPESLLVQPGVIRPETAATITIINGESEPTPFEPAATVAVDGSNVPVTSVTADQITAAITTPPDEKVLTVTVTNPGTGLTFEGSIAVRNRTGEFHPLSPTRVFDSRFPALFPPLRGASSRVHAGEEISVAIGGRGSIPTDGIQAVAVNITAVDPSDAGFLTAWPSGTPRPDTSSINYAAGRTVANLATLALGADGGLALVASTDTDVVLDVVGWYASAPTVLPDRSPVASSYLPLPSRRFVDTRVPDAGPYQTAFAAAGPLRAGEIRNLPLGVFNVSCECAADAVALNVTVADTSTSGFLTIWPADQPRPNASNISFGAGETIPNMVVVPEGGSGEISVYNSAGSTDIIIDLVGLYETPRYGALVFTSVPPTRIADSRFGTGMRAGPMQAGEVVELMPRSIPPVPASAHALVMNAVVADSSTVTGYVAIYSPAFHFEGSSLNAQPGRAAANQVIVPLLTAGAIDILNANGPANVIIDVTGFFT
jgi:hypothetical protein